jgi:Putative beta-barrel porin-2, OmpL-like. bbp2
MKRIPVFIMLMLICQMVNAQVVNTAILDTTGGQRIGKITIGGYLDGYYGYVSSKPSTGDVPYFVTMNRHNEANINLAFLDLRYNGDRLRSRFVAGFGTYMDANYTNETGSIKNILEASMGVKIFKNKEIWLEFGVLGSPYTNESAISRDHLMYTRSLAPEYVPYYLSGAKLDVPLSNKVTAYLYILNGWQQIKDQNAGKSLGTQIEWRPNNQNLFNWNTYIGDERTKVDPNNRMRYFTDVYWIFTPNAKFSATSSAYIGLQQSVDSLDQPSKDRIWWQANFVVKYNFTEKVSLSGRIEYFDDTDNVQIKSNNGIQAVNLWSAGLCMNVKITNNALFRLEGRHFYATSKMYKSSDGNDSNDLTWLISNLTIWF